MIDFRYHLVSLISVFLALAVGIALGAGPLKETIGDSLTGQVSKLREEKDALRTALADATADVNDRDAYLEAQSPALLDGALTGRRVVLVLVDDVDAGTVRGMTQSVGLAGGTVTGVVHVLDRWTDPDERVFRQALAGRLAEYLPAGQPADATLEDTLATALAQAVTDADGANPDALSQKAALVLDLLTSKDGALVRSDEELTVPADAVIVLTSSGPVGDTAPSASPSAAGAEMVDAERAIAVALQRASEGALVAGDTLTPGDLVSTIRASGDDAKLLSTTTGTSGLLGRINAVLGLNARIAGSVGHYGFDSGATAPAATRYRLTPIVRTASGSTGDAVQGLTG